MSDLFDSFDGSPENAPLSPELAALIERIETDAVLWEAHAPADDGRLAAHARELAGDAAQSTGGVALLERPHVDTSPSADAGSAAPRQPRAGRVLAYVSTILVVALIVGSLTLFHRPATTVPTATPTATATETPLPSPTATSTATPQPTATNASGGPGGAAGGYPVARAQVNTSPSGWTNDHCGATMPFTLMATFWFAPGAPGGTIRYRWLRSDDYIGPSQSVTYSPGAVALTDPASLEWDVPAASADGTDKWAAIEVLSPNAVTSPHGTFQATCQFTIQSAQAAYVSGGDGKNPPGYDCTAGGDQTFTFSGTINVGAAPGSHTIQYHWLRSDGTSSQVYSLTVSPGLTSVATQSDSWVIHQADPGGNHTDQIVVDSAPSTPSNAVQFFKMC